MAWTVLFDEEFAAWFETVAEGLQDEILVRARLLQEFGPNLGRPHVDTLKGSKSPNLKELRIQHRGAPWRVIFAFDPKRSAILLVGGDKSGDKRWYAKHIEIAESRFERHLERLGKEADDADQA
ncbi:MAG: type II toxin-antitoxin system RelE/ParE family toxin [Isosphaeraceae bacterium]